MKSVNALRVPEESLTNKTQAKSKRPEMMCGSESPNVEAAFWLRATGSLHSEGINRTRMENRFHRLSASGRLNITVNDRFGHPVEPQEWFLIPLFIIDEAVERIKDGTITNYVYDPIAAQMVRESAAPPGQKHTDRCAGTTH